MVNLRRKLLEELLFSGLSEIRFLDELNSSKQMYFDLLQGNNFTTHLYKRITSETMSKINCKYYDSNEFNMKIANSGVFFSLLHVNLQSSFKNYAVLKAHLDTGFAL